MLFNKSTRQLAFVFLMMGLSPFVNFAAAQNIDPRLEAYMNTLRASESAGDQLLLTELERSIEISQGPPYDAIEAGKIIPGFCADLFGKNGWQKGHTPGRSIEVEKYLFKPVAATPQAFSQLDLVRGFNRQQTLSEIDSVCTYHSPKLGTGTRPGFKAVCNGLNIKVKFKELHTQALASRVFWALGYNSDPADYHPGLKIAYDRRIFDEFNLRTGTPLKIKFGSKEVKVLQLNPHFEAVKYIVSATLKDGTVIGQEALAAKLARGDDQDIVTLLTAPAQLQYGEIEGRIAVGPWSFNDADHWESRSLRAVGVVAAWLAIYDIRRDNNLLVVDMINGKPTPRYLFPDLGSGLGKARYRLSLFDNIESVKDFSWSIAKGGKIRGFNVNEENSAFAGATREDFAYGVQLINQFSTAQIRELLAVAGYQGSELEEYYHKLISRRESLNREFLKP